MKRQARARGLILIALILLTAASCAVKREVPRVEIEVEPLILEEKLPELRDAQIIDSALLIEKADKLRANGQLEQAIAIYKQVCHLVGEESICIEAAIKRAQCLVELDRAHEAEKMLEALNERIQDVSTKLDVIEELASLEEMLGNFAQAAELRALATELSQSNPILRFHHEVRLALNLYLLGKPEAEELMDSLIAEAEQMKWHRLPIAREDEAALYFYRAEFIRERFEAIEFHGTDKVLEAQLEEKVSLLYRAKKLYIRAITTHHPLWMSAALYRLGGMYEDFYHTVMNAPIPPMKQEEKKEYIQMLEEKVSLVREKAAWLYRKNLRLANQLRIDNEWVEKSKKALRKLEKRHP